MTPWITRTHRTVADTVPAVPGQVRAFYVDLDNILSVHPLIVEVRSTGRRDIPDDVATDSRQFPRVRLRSVVSFTAITAGDGNVVATRVVEHIDIEAPALLAGVTVRQATAAHVEMLSGIRRRFMPEL